MTAHTIRYLCNLASKNRQVSASDLAQGLSVEIGVCQPLRTTSKRKPLLKKRHKSARLNFAKERKKRDLINIGSTFFGQMKPKLISLDQMGSSMFGMDLARTTTLTAQC